MTDDLVPSWLLGDAVWTADEFALLDSPIVDADELARIARDLVTEEQAAWAMAEVARLERHAADVEMQAAAWQDRIDEWREQMTLPANRRALFLRERLERYALACRAATGDKTFRFPSGEITTTKGGDAFKAVVVDEAQVLEWAASALSGGAYADVVKQSESVRVSELRKHVLVKDGADGAPVVIYDGEIVPGLGTEPPNPTTAHVKPAV